jgi:hypothetical protein
MLEEMGRRKRRDKKREKYDPYIKGVNRYLSKFAVKKNRDLSSSVLKQSPSTGVRYFNV